MEMMEFLGVFGVDSPSLRSVEQCRKDDGLVHLQLGIQLEAVATPDGVPQPAEGLADFGGPVGNLIVDSDAVGKCASEIGKNVHGFELVAVGNDSRRSAMLRVR
nr:unnamed protein product [Spirometra erinaceieuropaei]